MMMLAVPATIGLMVVAPRFVPLFFGEEFIPATVSLQVLSLLIFLVGINNFFGWQVLFAMGYEKKILIITLFGFVSNLCLNILFARQYGSLGVSIAYIITEIIVALMVIIFALNVMPIRINAKSIYQPITAALPIIPISIYISRIMEHNLIYLLLTVAISTILYGLIMIFIFKNDQVNQILNFIIRKIRS
jgi:O-antigen/teichoic acid export membrane protein